MYACNVLARLAENDEYYATVGFVICLLSEEIDRMWQKVLNEERSSIVDKAVASDAFVNRLLDHLLGKHCIQMLQKQEILTAAGSTDRCRKLLDFIYSTNQKTFDELCNAIEKFGTPDTKDLADCLRCSLETKQRPWRECLNGKHVLQWCIGNY